MNDFETIVSDVTFCGSLYIMPMPDSIAEGKLIVDGDYTIFYDKHGNKTIVKKQTMIHMMLKRLHVTLY